MIRFILSCLVALSFVGSAPAVAAMATQPPAPQASECTMSGDETPNQPADHGKMACCTTDCTMAGTVGLAQPGGLGVAELAPAKALLLVSAVKKLDSLDVATVDPPPRA